jgi:WD40 repeat protein/serine/threonine protein kinase
MKPDSERIKEIFAQALRCRTAAERESILAEACQGDIELRHQVETLLQAHEKAGDFLAQTMKLPMVEFESERMGSVIGRYKLLEKIGEGGFGVVYMAEQQEPVQRKVALKIIKAGMDTREVIARFEAERQALALMDHPNIAKVLDAGTTEAKRPYFVMELVRGIPITDYCDEKNLSTTERLQLFIKVCQAVQHAHQKAVIHRDLKPSNILVTLHDSEPVPKVIDFGVAKALGQKLTEKTLFTSFRQMIGTPAYMSPEQAEMSGLDIDTRSDIYSLGVLLYELLTGVTPFDKEILAKAALDEIRRMIRETEPPKPSTRLRTLGEKITDVAKHRRVEPMALSKIVRGDLDWIVMKCLDKDRQRRYETANGLAMDIQRHLQNELVTASPPSALYKVQKFAHRNKGTLTAMTAIAVFLIAGAVVSTWQAVRARRAESKEKQERAYAISQERLARSQTALAEAEKLATQRHLYAADMFRAHRAMQDGNFGLALEALSAHKLRPGTPDLRGFEWYYLRRLCDGDKLFSLPGHSGEAYSVAFSPDSRMIGSAGADHLARLWDTDARKQLATFEDADRLAFSPDGRFFFTVALTDHIRMYETATLKQVGVYSTGLGSWKGATPAVQLAVSPVGTLLGACINASMLGGRGSVWLFDYAKGEVVGTLTNSGDRMAFSADGKTLVTGSSEGSLKLWDVATGQMRETLGPVGGVCGLALSPDGRYCAATEFWSGDIRLWDVQERKELSALKGHSAMAWVVVFSPDGRLLASASSDQTIRLWDVASRREVDQLRGHASEIWTLAFSHDGRTLLSGSKDETIAVWPVQARRKPDALRPVWPDPHWPVFSPDGAWMAEIGPEEQDVQICQLADLANKSICSGQLCPLALSEGARVLTTLSVSNALQKWDVGSRTLERQILLQEPGFRLTRGKLSPNARTVAGGSDEGRVAVWEAETGHLLQKFQPLPGGIYDLAFSPDSLLLAASSDSDGTVQLWDCASLKELATLSGHKLNVRALAFSPDGRLLATACIDNTVKFWSTTNFVEQATLRGHKEGVNGVAFSPDSQTLATASWDKTLKLWHVATLREMATFTAPGGLGFVGFSPDSRTLVYGVGDTVHVLRASRPAQGSLFPTELAREGFALPGAQLDLSTVEFFARRGHWSQAAENAAKALELRPTDHVPYHMLAPLLVAIGDADGYRQVCQKILAQFQGTPNAFVADRMAKDCLVLPSSGADWKIVGQLAETAVTAGKNQSALPYFQCTKALAEYRMGHFASAVDWAQKSIDNPSYPRDASRFVEAYMVLAMAQYQMTQTDEARATSAKGMVKADELTKLDSGDVGDGWRDWIIAHALMKEAKVLINGESAPPTSQPKEK